MSEIPAEAEKCEHYWAWVSPAGTSNSARLCMLCHQPDADWLNTIFEREESRVKWINSSDLLVNTDEKNPDKHIIFRQVGWHGQTGRLYTMDEKPGLTERGSFGPLYVQIAPE